MSEIFEKSYKNYLATLEKLRRQEISMVAFLDVLDDIKGLDLTQFRERESKRLNKRG